MAFPHDATGLSAVMVLPDHTHFFCNHLDKDERGDCFTFIVFGMSCYCQIVVTLPLGVVGWSAVCDCCIS